MAEKPYCPNGGGPQFFPSSPRRGGRDLNQISRSFLYRADGVVIKFHRIFLRLNTTPSARAKDASRLFLDRAATLPRRGGENSPHDPFGQQPLTAGATFFRFTAIVFNSRIECMYQQRHRPGDVF